MIKGIKKIVLIFGCGLSFCNGFSQMAPAIQWAKCYGGTLGESAFSIALTTDGGYIVAGETKSNDGDVSGNHGGFDCWVIKIDSIGNLQWQKCLGGSFTEFANSVQQTYDSGYIIAGFTNSNDGDVSGNHLDSTGTSTTDDYWVVKLDSTGTLQWQKCFGGSDYDVANSIQQTMDNGYIVAGYTQSNDGDVSGLHLDSINTGTDNWIVKLDSTGTLEWQKCLGGRYDDGAYSLEQTIDKGYIAAGYTKSNDSDVAGNHSNQNDYWVVKIDSLGNLQWQKCLGGTADDFGRSLDQTQDGGYIMNGYTLSNNGDVTGFRGVNDFWVTKLDSNGNLEWQKCLGGSVQDFGACIKQDSKGGYILGGPTNSSDGDVTGNHGGRDSWIVRLDSIGNLLWQKCLGGSSDDGVSALQQTNDGGGYIIAGNTFSNDGNVTGNHGTSDFWIVKLAPDTITSVPNLQSSTSTFQLSPNPATSTIQLTFNTKEKTNLQLEIVNVMGEKVYQTELQTLNFKLQTNLDVSFLAKGIYVVRIGDGSGWENKKLVVE